MLTVLSHRRRTCGGFARRELLQIGGAGLLGVSLPKVWAAEAEMEPLTERAKSVLFVFLYGGPSQLETFDMKPDAASPGTLPVSPADLEATIFSALAIAPVTRIPDSQGRPVPIIEDGRPLMDLFG